MKRKTKDRNIDIPAEANRGKHINFVAIEEGETDPRNDNMKGALAADAENREISNDTKDNSRTRNRNE